jgi:PAS domain-containing protein
MLEIPSPEVFKAIVDRVETGVYAIDLEQKISYWNYGAGKITVLPEPGGFGASLPRQHPGGV